VPGLIAAIASTLLAYLPHELLGERLDPATDLVVSSAVGVVSYWAIRRWAARLRGES
jgi:hypothetical protein